MSAILGLENFVDQQNRLPENGRHILAHHDDDSIIVYQAYRPNIGMFAASNGYFGGQFSFDRMTWIKTNFLWMMYRSEWGTKSGQEVILAIRLRRDFFDRVLSQSVAAIFEESSYKNKNDWKKALSSSPIRLQWDPDRDPCGNAIGRRAIQLGLKGEMVRQFSTSAIIDIEDISSFVKSLRRRAMTGQFRKVNMPRETIYSPASDTVANRIGLSKE